ncbi:MAG: cyclic nucleotide-binding domain-containing protein [Deltaproteobacteria bacterium]|nr:cyclic nucleotide-binding domain-containing protein [Deltaproteobacteria bacterium]
MKKMLSRSNFKFGRSMQYGKGLWCQKIKNMTIVRKTLPLPVVPSASGTLVDGVSRHTVVTAPNQPGRVADPRFLPAQTDQPPRSQREPSARLWHAPKARPPVLDAPQTTSGANGADSGGNGDNINSRIQKQIQEVSTDKFGVTNLSVGSTAALNAVVWCQGMGMHINPSLDSLHVLENAGINPNDTGKIILTKASESIAEALVKIALRRERIAVIATADVFENIVLMARSLLGDEYDITRWVDHQSISSDTPMHLDLADQTRVTITLDSGNELNIKYLGSTLSSRQIGKLKALETRRIVACDLAKDKDALKRYLQGVSLLAHLDERDVAPVINEAQFVSFDQGDTIIREGETADCCYILLTGSTEVTGKDDRVLWNFFSRDFFGEVGLQSGNPRNANVIAKTAVRALRINKHTYNQYVFNPLYGTERFTSTKYVLEKFLRSLRPDIHLSEASVEAIALRTKKQYYADEIREGEIGDCAYILLEGEVEVVRSDSDAPLATLRANELFGEMALFNPSSRRTATVRAKPGTRPKVLRIDRNLFEFILYSYPGVDHEVQRVMVRRRRENRESLSSPHMVRIPDFLTRVESVAGTGRAQDAIYSRWRSFCRIYNIDFKAMGISINELRDYAAHVDVLMTTLNQILGSSLLRQRVIRQIRFGSHTDMGGSQYQIAEGVLTVSKDLLARPASQFAGEILQTLGLIVSHHLMTNEFLPEEKQRLQAIVGVMASHHATAPAVLSTMMPKIASDDTHALESMLSHFFGLYVVRGDEFRASMNMLGINADLKKALDEIYHILRKLFFQGIEFTRLNSQAAISDIPGRRGLSASKTTFVPLTAAEEIRDILNAAFDRFAFCDSSYLCRRIYEPEVYHALKISILNQLSQCFLNFNIQKFSEDLIEIAVYDSTSCTRAVVQFQRVKKGVMFSWQIKETDEGIKISHGHAPVAVTMVNLNSPEFGGVKGTPESILAVQGYLEEHRRHQAAVAVFDCQWPENNVDALIDEIRINAPDILAISASFGALQELENLIEKTRHMERRPLIVVGGLLSTWSYEYLLMKFPEIIAVRYEGEESMAHLVDLVASMPVDDRRTFIAHNVEALDTIANIAFIHDNVVHTHERQHVDLSAVPPPDRTTEAKRQVAAGFLMNAEGQGRGCGYSACYFCTRTHGKFRSFPLTRGLKDFENYMRAGVPFVVYVDEDFLADPGDQPVAAMDFADSIITLKEKYRQECLVAGKKEPVMPSFYIAARAQSIYKEGDAAGNIDRIARLHRLKEAGLVKIFLGAESGSPTQFHKTYNKGGSVHEVEQAIRVIRENGIQVVAGFITFDPVMSLSQLSEDLSFMETNGLVYVDPLTEPLNPFKYFRAQAGSTLARRLGQAGLLSSTMDPSLLMHDVAYRNPLIRLITRCGNVWKQTITKLDYHLKGIIWFAEQSEEEMQRAHAFVALFNRLKQADFKLIKDILDIIASATRDLMSEEEGLNRFFASLENLPPEKVLFEVKRQIFPHTDIWMIFESYIRSQRANPDFNLNDFLKQFLQGQLPSDFIFDRVTPDDLQKWLKDIRADISQNMITVSELSVVTEKVEKVLRAHISSRITLLQEFADTNWREYYESNPDALRRGIGFQQTLAETVVSQHAVLKKTEPLVVSGDLASPQFVNHWRTTLDAYLSYRHPNMGDAVSVITRVLNHLKDHPDAVAFTPEDIVIYADGHLEFRGNPAKKDHQRLADLLVEKLYMNVLNVFENNDTAEKTCLEIYTKSKQGGYHNGGLGEIIRELEALYRQASEPVALAGHDASLAVVARSLDRKTEVEMGGSRVVLFNAGKYAASKLILHGCPTVSLVDDGQIVVDEDFRNRMPEIWREVLNNKTGLSEQEKYNVINSLVELMSRIPYVDDAWLDALAHDADAIIASGALYLPDTPDYHDWPTQHHDIKIVFVHPLLYNKIWPDIKPHLGKLVYLAKPQIFDDLSHMLQLVASGQLSPDFATFIYEVYYNKLSPKAFLRNDDREHVISNYTALSFRVMPKRTLVLLLDKGDGRVAYFEPATTDVRESLESVDGKIRLVVHPQVYHRWRTSDPPPYSGYQTSFALVFPTSSARTLYVLDEQGDFIAKTHSEIWIGPAMRQLTQSNVSHSHLVSRQVSAAIDSGELPPDIRDVFGFINDSGGAVITDAALNEAKGSVGVINRSSSGYPSVSSEQRILIPGFAAHNNCVTVDNNHAPEVLVQLINHNVSQSGRETVDYFVETIVRPLYKIFLYFMFKQGILLEPHGQNFFIEVDDQGKITRLIFKDWQSTMIDMEKRIRRGLPDGNIVKHLLGTESGIPLSLSLVYDYYFSTYLFRHIFDTIAGAYHQGVPLTAFKVRLRTHLRQVFEEELGLYRRRLSRSDDAFPDFMVRHGRKPSTDKTNDVYFKIAGPPPFRFTAFERALFAAVEERHVRGAVDIPIQLLEDAHSKLTQEEIKETHTINLERTRLFVTTDNHHWTDVRDKGSAQGAAPAIQNAYYLVLPEDYDPTKEYPVVMMLHGMNSDLKEISGWVDKLGVSDAITVIPFGPFGKQDGHYSWFERVNEADKNRSTEFLTQILADLKGKIKIGQKILGGISQGGYMALHAMVFAPEAFDAVFAVNAPFAQRYLGTLPDTVDGKHKPVLLLHLEGDQIVPERHAIRAEEFFGGRGFSVRRDTTTVGQHDRITANMAARLQRFLEDTVKGASEQNIFDADRLRVLADKATRLSDEELKELISSVETMGYHHITGHEIIIYEMVLDKQRPLVLRCAALSTLEQISFAPIFDIWKNTTLLEDLREAASQLAVIKRTIPFLVSHISLIGKSELSDDEQSDFEDIVSSFRLFEYNFSRVIHHSENDAQPQEIKELIATIGYLCETTLELQARVAAKT